MARSKRYQELKKNIDPKKVYDLADALTLVKETAKTKFESSVEVHFRLGIDVRQSDQQIRTTVVLPHSIGKTKKIAAFVSADKMKEATEAGADLVGGEEMIEELSRTGKVDFEVAVATPDMMIKLAKIAKILGPKGLMPNPKTETVGPNVVKMIEELKRGKVTIKSDATGNVHQVIGKTSLEDAKLTENFQTLLATIRKVKPAKAKGVYIKNAVITSTMGPAIRIDIGSAT
ncbi:MAG: 50S ribosomal protein L1 [bacterium]|nr:50S ribosomal protein L1 [bacterium]